MVHRITKLTIGIIVTFLSLASSVPAAQAEVFRLEEATIADITAAFDAGAMSCRQLTQLYLNRSTQYIFLCRAKAASGRVCEKPAVIDRRYSRSLRVQNSHLSAGLSAGRSFESRVSPLHDQSPRHRARIAASEDLPKRAHLQFRW